MTQNAPLAKVRGERGFSMVELLVVMAIIGIMLGVSLPGIIAYFRTAKIRAAQTSVAAQIQAARLKAVAKNVNVGVVFVTADRNTFGWIVEDPPPGVVGVGARGTLQDLPDGVVFGGGAGTDAGFRFNRLGAWCDPVEGCAALPADLCDAAFAAMCDDAPGNYVQNDANGALITLVQQDTGLTRTIRISPGGRIQTQ